MFCDTNPQAAPITASEDHVGGATVRGGGVCHTNKNANVELTSDL